MNFLLLLSALTAALTGAISGVRSPEIVSYQQSGAVAGCAVSVASPVAAVSPARSWLMLAAPAAQPYAAAPMTDQLFGMAAFAPLYLGKLRR